MADAAQRRQVWTGAGWAERFGLSFPIGDTGYGHTPEQVGAVRASGKLLRGYFDEVNLATTSYLGTLSEDDLDEVVDRRWDPPVTLGTRLVSVLSDDLQHVGQAAFIRGLCQQRRRQG